MTRHVLKHLLFIVTLFAAIQLHAQTPDPASGGAKFAGRRGDLQIGVAGSYLRPDYGPSVGAMISPYAALDFRKRSYLGVELDGNLTVHTKASTNPNSVLFGVRLGRDYGPARLYLKPAIGIGHFSGVTTVPSGGSEVYFIYEFGGGVDLQVSNHINTRFFAAYQIWPTFDGNTIPALDHGGALNPIYAGVGAAYRF